MTLQAAVIPTLMRDEGKRLKPYRCPAGKLTIGYGRNLDDVGVTDDEAMAMLEHDVDASIADCQKVFPWFEGLDQVRQGVIVQMRFQLGLAGLLGFRNVLRAIARRDFVDAATEMLDSQWARDDSPARAQRLAKAMRTGKPV
jgi:lysozyme